MKLIGEIIGVIGIIVNFLIYQQTDRKRVLKVKLLSDICWSLHYGLISAFSGMAVTLVGVARETTFILTDDKKESRKYFLLGFAIIACTTSILTMKDLFGLLPALASLIAVFSYWQQNPTVTKILAIPISTSMIIYDLFRFSITGIVNETLTLVSIAIALISLYVTKKKSIKN